MGYGEKIMSAIQAPKAIKDISNFQVGDYAQCNESVTEKNTMMYAVVTGDLNPVHISEKYAQTTFFKRRIVHGMFLGGLISKLLGMELPGPGTIFLEQKFKFLNPVYFGDIVTAKVEIFEIIPEKRRIRLKTTCHNQKGILVMDGIACVSIPKK